MTRGILATIEETRRQIMRAIAAAAAAGETQNDIAARCCISQGQLANIARGARKPRPWLLDLMADELSIEIAATIRARIDPMDITTGAQSVSSTGPVTGTLDTSALTTAPGVRLIVNSLTGTSARIAIEDTANSSAFSDAQQAAIFDITGPITTEIEMHRSAYEMPSLRFGAANCKLRVNVLALNGSSPNLNVYAFAG